MAYFMGSPFVQQFFDSNGDPLENGTIEFYIWNTSTPTNIYSDSVGTSAGTSVTLNSWGAPVNGGGTPIALFFDTSVTYKIIRKTAAGAAIAPTIGPYKPLRAYGVYAEDYATLSDAVTAAQGRELVISENTVVSANTTVSGCAVRFVYPGNLDPNAGVTITFDPTHFTPANHCFDKTALGTITTTAGDWVPAPGMDVRWWGAVGDGVTDDYQAFVDALDAYDHVLVPEGTFAVGDMITVTENKCLELQQGATIIRKSSLSASTDPVIWLKETGATLVGANRSGSAVETENASPLGVVRIGFEDEVETGRVIRNCGVSKLRVAGMVGDGATSGSPNVCVYVPCAQNEVNYYHTLSELFLTDANHGIWLHGQANGLQISKIFGESLGNASLDGVLLYLHGATDCSVSGAFMSGNGASGSGAILLKFSNLGAVRSTHNYISGIVGEMGVNGLLVESTDTGASAPVSNVIEGIDNTGGINVNDDFWNNNIAAINDFHSVKGGIRFPATASTSSDSHTLDYYAETQSYSTAPTIDSATPGTGRATTVNHAKWTRIGNLCYVSLRVTLTTLGSGGAGNLRIVNGLPFTCISDSGNYLGGLEIPNYENLAVGVRTIKAGALPGTKDIAIYITTADTASNAQMDFATYAQATMQFYITGIYAVA